MTADVTTMATWGDSESTSSSNDESEEEDEDTPNDEAEIDEEDDGMFTCCQVTKVCCQVTSRYYVYILLGYQQILCLYVAR